MLLARWCFGENRQSGKIRRVSHDPGPRRQRAHDGLSRRQGGGRSDDAARPGMIQDVTRCCPNGAAPGARAAKRTRDIGNGADFCFSVAEDRARGSRAPREWPQAFAKVCGIICPSRIVRSIQWRRVRTGRAIFGFRWSLAPLRSIRPPRSAKKVSFNRINRKTGNRLKQQNVDLETGEVVSRDDMVRGYEVAKGHYMVVEDEEIEAVQIESTRTIDIDQFVPKNEIDERYVDSPYYIAPDGAVGQEAFAVIRDTIAKLNMVALGRVVLARREHVIALEPKGHGLVGTTLRYPYEVRDEKPYFEDIPELKLPKEMLDLAAHIVQTKSGHFDPSLFEDRYENALIDLLKKKQAGEKIEAPRETPPPRVVNLMEALRASIDAEQKKAPAPSTRARRPAKKKASR